MGEGRTREARNGATESVFPLRSFQNSARMRPTCGRSLVKWLRPHRFFSLCFTSGARVILGLASKKKKKKKSTIRTCTCVLWHFMVRSASAGCTTTIRKFLTNYTQYTQYTVHCDLRSARNCASSSLSTFRLVQGTKLVYMYSMQHLFLFFFFFLFFRTPSLLLAGWPDAKHRKKWCGLKPGTRLTQSADFLTRFHACVGAIEIEPVLFLRRAFALTRVHLRLVSVVFLA